MLVGYIYNEPDMVLWQNASENTNTFLDTLVIRQYNVSVLF